jgi:hypothetical protein
LNPITVTQSNPYFFRRDLNCMDRDNDGIGCKLKSEHGIGRI